MEGAWWLILWAVMAILTLVEYSPDAAEISLVGKIVVFFTLAIGAPVLFMYSAIKEILDLFMPEGWDDDDDQFRH